MYRGLHRKMGILKGLTDEYFGEIKREEDYLVLKPSKKEDITIIDEDKLLTPYLYDILQNGASLDFRMGGYSSLANMLNTLGVNVHICKGIKWFYDFHLDDFFDGFEKYWRMKLSQRHDLLEPILNRLEEERGWMTAYTIRGRYLPKERIIELYPEEMKAEMKAEPDGKKYLDYLLLTTFVHEAMHAYFDRPEHSDFPYAYFVEEPMAEFGMLLFLKETKMPDALKKWAYNDVSGMRCCYRFGATLFDQYCDWNISLRDYLEAYKYGISKYEMLDVDICKKLVALPYPDYEKIGQLAKREFTRKIPTFTIDVLLDLQDATYCKKEFNIKYPILSKSRDPQNRYYKDHVNGYYICKEWYESYREKLEDWLSRH